MNPETENKAVDFDNPDAVNAALEAEAAAELGADAPATKKPRKPAGPKIIKVKFTADRDIAAGETIEFDYEVPKGASRGVVAGIPLEEMTDDQLKIEYRNANSVAYKTKKAGRDHTKADDRVARVVAEMDKRGIKPTARAQAVVTAETIADLIKSGKVSVDDIQAILDGANAEDTEAAE